MTSKELVNSIRSGEIDPNNHQSFFGTMIRALILDLNKLMKIRGIPVPHMVINTGDDTIWLMEKEYDYRIEPCDISNEQYIYNIVPRCVVNMTGMDLQADQLSNPYVRGNFQYEIDNQLFTLNAEFRRMPVKVNVDLKYFLDSFNDSLEICQHIYSKLVFVRTYKFVYMGQTMIASYTIPTGINEEHQTEIDGKLQEQRNHSVSISLEVECNLPVYEPKTVVDNVHITQPLIKTDVETHETNERNLKTRADHRSFGKR